MTFFKGNEVCSLFVKNYSLFVRDYSLSVKDYSLIAPQK